MGMLGKNLTPESLLEDDVHIGDRLQIGTVVLMVTQPHQPSYRLGTKFHCNGMPERFLTSRGTGFCFAVAKKTNSAKATPLSPSIRT